MADMNIESIRAEFFLSNVQSQCAIQVSISCLLQFIIVVATWAYHRFFPLMICLCKTIVIEDSDPDSEKLKHWKNSLSSNNAQNDTDENVTS